MDRFIALLLVGAAALLTLLAPAHLLRCERQLMAEADEGMLVARGGRVDCSATRLALWVIPCWYQRAEGVSRISNFIEKPEPSSHDFDSQSTETAGYLRIFSGQSGHMTLEVSPASLKVARKLKAFLEGQDRHFTRYLVANWKFGFFVPLLPGLPGAFVLFSLLRERLQTRRQRRLD